MSMKYQKRFAQKVCFCYIWRKNLL